MENALIGTLCLFTILTPVVLSAVWWVLTVRSMEREARRKDEDLVAILTRELKTLKREYDNIVGQEVIDLTHTGETDMTCVRAKTYD